MYNMQLEPFHGFAFSLMLIGAGTMVWLCLKDVVRHIRRELLVWYTPGGVPERSALRTIYDLFRFGLDLFLLYVTIALLYNLASDNWDAYWNWEFDVWEQQEPKERDA